MLSAMAGAPRRTRALGSGTEYSGSMRSELRIETTVRASTRLVLSAGRGATADTSAGAAVRRAAAVVGSACGVAEADATLGPAATSAGAFLSGVDTAVPACCTRARSNRGAAAGAGTGVLVFALAAAGLAAAASAGVEAGVEGEEEVETTTVDDLTSVVVQPPGVV